MAPRPLRIAAVLLTACIWLIVTAAFWTGYTGEDDLFYARYAFLLHRPPIVWWEFRIPAVLAMRASFLLFGPTEFAAALPSLLASLAILGSVAWFVGWPRTLTWQSQSAVLLAALLPLDVAFRSYPSAGEIAAGALAVGTVMLLKGSRRTQVGGAAALALGYMTHELSVFYIGLLCLVALCFDRRRYLRPVLWCGAIAAMLVTAEAITYGILLGDPLARIHVSAGGSTVFTSGVDPETSLSGLRFYLWPVQIMLFAKQFGFDLLLLFVTGALAWRLLNQQQRILLTTVVLVFLWHGYGTVVPWAYRPLYREFHYYSSLSLGVAALLPFTLGFALAQRQWAARTTVVLALLVHVASLSAGGRWGAPVDVSRELLAYAREHPDQRFLTDVNTLNQMYVLNGFRLPSNVVCLDGRAVREHLLLNKEPPAMPRFRFADGPVDAILVNREQHQLRGFEREFTEYVAAHAGPTTVVAPVRYRLPFVPLLPFVEPREFMVRSAGGEAVSLAAVRAAGT